jgi:flagellar hook-associated protein 2
VDGKLITLDLESDSIADIITKINAAGGQASVVSEPFGDETRYRLVVQGNVQAVDGDADSAAIIETLGLEAGGFGSVQQVVSTGAFTSSADAIATSSTLLEGLKVAGQSADLAAGDAINIRGTRGDGTAVTIGLVVEPGDTMQTLLDKINDATSGFGSGSRPATATLGSDGVIRLMDGTGGESRLSLSLGIVRADDTTGNLGVPTTTTTGRARELVVGQDAQVMVDGVLVTRSSNTIAEVIPGVSMSLLNAEPGTEIDLTVSKNVDSGLAAVKTFADAYNAILKFFDEQRAEGQPLATSSTLRGIMSEFTSSLRTEVATNGTYSRLSLMGLALDRTGVLTVDESKVRAALSEKPDEVEALFGFDGVGNAFVDATDNATRFGTGTISSQIKSIDDGDFRLNLRKTEAERRLEDRRAALIDQYVKMERALSALNSQGSFLTQQIKSFQGNS